MKQLILVAALTILIFTNCSKTSTTHGSASWTIESALPSQNYSSNSVSRTGGNQLLANGANTMQVFFSSMPTTSGTFAIANESKAVTNSLAANEIAVELEVGATDVYTSISETVSAIVTVNSNGIVSVAVPPIAVIHNNAGLDTCYGTISEQ